MGWYWCFIGLPSRIWGANRNIPWPVNPRTIVSNAKNIEFDIDDIHIFQTPGCYWQNQQAKIIIGRNCYVAPNVGLITTNHDVYDVTKHVAGKDIVLGEKCWIGMNAMILPGVTLGPHTVVGAGSVVTHSFPQGNCVIAGNPAKVIREL
jgi:acetyltransferase-like isoleucine patch superfamily enzyme